MKYNQKKKIIKLTKFIIFGFIAFLYISCFSKQEEEEENHFNLFKSKDNFSTYLTLESYYFKTPRNEIPAIYRINNLVIDDTIKEKKVINITEGKFKVEALYLGMKTNVILVNAKKGDSIVISFFLKESDEKFDHFNYKKNIN